MTLIPAHYGYISMSLKAYPPSRWTNLVHKQHKACQKHSPSSLQRIAVEEFGPHERCRALDGNSVQDSLLLCNNKRVCVRRIENFAHDFHCFVNSALLDEPTWCFWEAEDCLASNGQAPCNGTIDKAHAVIEEVCYGDTKTSE